MPRRRSSRTVGFGGFLAGDLNLYDFFGWCGKEVSRLLSGDVKIVENFNPLHVLPSSCSDDY